MSDSMSRDEWFARKHLTDYFREYDDVGRMNTRTNSDVKCVATLETKVILDEYGQASIGSKAWFLRNWSILNPEVDTAMARRHRDGLFDDMKRILNLNEDQHFGVDVSDTPGIDNPVVFYIKELLSGLAVKYDMTLQQALQTIHDTQLGTQKMGFINEAFDDPIALRNPPSKRLDINVYLPHLEHPTLPAQKTQFSGETGQPFMRDGSRHVWLRELNYLSL
jgi:hypothetical protein